MHTETQIQHRYYYVSIAFYGHKVFKCAGICPDKAHADFYVPHFQKEGTSAGKDPKGHEVVILDDFYGDRVIRDEDGIFVKFIG